MVVGVTRQQALQRRQKYVTPGGATTFVSTYVGTNKMELLALGKTPETAAAALAGQPMAYLVEQAPHDTVDPHYHQVEQFQIFVGGAGRIGTHALHGVTVHYAGPHSPYGPIVAGPEGVQYLTLRRDWDPGAQWMPEAAAALRSLRDRKHVASTSPPLQRCANLDQMQGLLATPVFEAGEDGPAAWQVCAGPGAAVQSQAASCGGQFWYVLAGSVQLQGDEYGAGSCLYQQPEEPTFECRAGSGGAEVVQVRFSNG